MFFRLLLASLAVSTAAQAATVGTLTLPADDDGAAVTLFYPTAAAGRAETRGDLQLMLAPDAPPAPGNGRLIAISHGSGGGPWVHTTLAKALVEDGFTVVLPLHRGDNWTDPGRAGPESWKQRPAEISHAIDRVAADPRFVHLKLDRVGGFGMSAGGHTMLSLAGGAWSPERFRARCERDLAEDFPACVGLATRLTSGALDGFKLWLARHVLSWKFRGDDAPQTHTDPRLVAIVAAVPAAADFDMSTLAHPRVPLGLITADGDRWLAPRFHSDAVLAACTGCERVAELHGAGHGALLAPPPPASNLGRLECDLLCDPEGFDRAAVTAQWVGATLAFFRKHLLGASDVQGFKNQP